MDLFMVTEGWGSCIASATPIMLVLVLFERYKLRRKKSFEILPIAITYIFSEGNVSLHDDDHSVKQEKDSNFINESVNDQK